jgi:hypothetical protein
VACVRRHRKSKVVIGLEAAFGRPGPRDELNRLRAAVVRSIQENDLSHAAAEFCRQVLERELNRGTCHIPAIHRALRRPSRQPPPSTRAVIEDAIRELEYENPERWAAVIERLRSVLRPRNRQLDQIAVWCI